MSVQKEQDFEEANRVRPPMSGYQKRVTSQTSEAVTERNKDVLIEAPTGAGKTRILSEVAKEIVENEPDSKILVLTHRRNLLKGLAGDPASPDLKKRLGEIAFWTGSEPGTVAEPKFGGINQRPNIVAGMVVTAANLDDLANYTHILIDEGHHASEKSAGREVAGAYAEVMNRCPNASVIAATATAFRGDGDKLHPRLEEAERFVVGVEETLQERRTVPIKTHVPKVRLSNGMTPGEVYVREVSAKRYDTANQIIKKLKNDAFYESCVDEAAKITGKGQTIVFCDDVAEVKKVSGWINKKLGEGSADMVFGERGDAANDRAFASYAARESQYLVSCLMIGEGYDMPETDSVISFNTSLTRGQQNQFGGRAARWADGKECGKYIDFGTGTARYGPLEEQHKVQSVRAEAFSGGTRNELKALRSAAIQSEGGWSVMPGEKSTLFFRREGKDYFRAFEVKNINKGEDNKRHFMPKTDRDGIATLPLKTMVRFVGDQVQDEAALIARSGGLKSKVYTALAHQEVRTWKEDLDLSASQEPVRQEAKLREAKIRASVRGDHQYKVGLRAALANVGEFPDKAAALKEGIRLSGAAFDEMVKAPGIPLNMTKDMQRMAMFINGTNLRKATVKDTVAMAKTIGAAFTGIRAIGVSKPVSDVVTGLTQVIEPAVSRVESKEVVKPKPQQQS